MQQPSLGQAAALDPTLDYAFIVDASAIGGSEILAEPALGFPSEESILNHLTQIATFVAVDVIAKETADILTLLGPQKITVTIAEISTPPCP